MLNDSPLRVAFIGAGNMARTHLQALRRVGTEHRVAAVFDASPSAAQTFAALAGPHVEPHPTLGGLLGGAKPHVVHICTPRGTHFEAARQALVAGAHVYVEKPFVETRAEAEGLFDLALERRLLICAGHQLMRDPVFGKLLERAADLRPIALVDSHFAFRSPTLVLHRSSARALAGQLLDILPHPLYTLLAGMEHFAPVPSRPEILAVSATPVELHLLLRQGEISGRLFVSLRARPVASTLSIAGGGGALRADFVRGAVYGAGNEGTSPLEKVGNPFLEGRQLVWRTAASLAGRLLRGGSYPGLVELFEAFYKAARGEGPPPLSVDHLRCVTAVYEEVASRVRRSAQDSNDPARHTERSSPRLPVAVVTGAGGFLGSAITRELAQRGFAVRGVGRSDPPAGLPTNEWVRADLGQAIAPDTMLGAAVVVHAAAETGGDFARHERNTIGATRNVLRAMHAAGVRRLVYVSSLSVLRPPTTPWERQTEQTPLTESPKDFGPYTWGKCLAERLVAEAQQRGDIEARIVRPAALIDLDHIEFPGLLGRRLFGRWYLGLGRPGLPLAVCGVDRAGAAIAWCAERFDVAPEVLNLIDHRLTTRRQLMGAFRQRGWRGRMVWVPIPLLAGALTLGRAAVALVHLQLPPRLAAWSILRPRRYQTAAADSVLTAAEQERSSPRLERSPPVLAPLPLSQRCHIGPSESQALLGPHA